MKKLSIKIITTGLLAILVTACGSPAYEYRKGSMAMNVDVPIGNSVNVGNTGLSVVFDSVEQDSRCPINAKCAQAGVAVVNATVISPMGERKAIKLSTVNYEALNNVEKAFGRDFELVGLLPKPVAGSGAKPEMARKLIKLKVN